MERDTFIIAVFCCIADLTPILLGTKPLRKGGFSPQLTDAEVMTIEVCGEFLKLSTDKDIFHYFYSHYRHFFPQLTDRTLFVRQAANLWVIKQQLWQLLVRISGEVMHLFIALIPYLFLSVVLRVLVVNVVFKVSLIMAIVPLRKHIIMVLKEDYVFLLMV